MNILVLGSGGREHALAWAIKQNPKCDRLIVAPGNAGIAQIAECAQLDPTDGMAVVAFCEANAIDFVVIGPEAPLAAGVADALADAGISAFGPSAEAARLEASKAFTKEICDACNAPTAGYARFTEAEAAKAYVREQGAPIVIKADGLAAGKGVTVAMTLDEALAAIDDCFEGAFGEAGAEVVVEAYLDGEEASFFCLSDGKTLLPLATAQDHKRVGDGDTGPNTGGMGAYSPAPVMTPDMVERTMKEIIEPTMRGMAEIGMPFQGVFFAGLMITNKGPELIEYNVRFGDPECQVVFMRLKSDLLPLLHASAVGTLDQVSAEWRDETALTVVLASKGYPGAYDKNTPISSLPDEGGETKVFHAGTALKDGKLVATGGRVLNVTALGKTVTEAQARTYEQVDAVSWDNGFCRRDIGWQAISREKA